MIVDFLVTILVLTFLGMLVTSLFGSGYHRPPPW